MTAWEALTGNSSLPAGTAWQHLNAQRSGSPGPIQIFGSMEVELVMAEFDAVLEVTEYEVSVDQSDLLAELEPNEIEAQLE